MQSKQTLKSISCSLPSVQPASAFDGYGKVPRHFVPNRVIDRFELSEALRRLDIFATPQDVDQLISTTSSVALEELFEILQQAWESRRTADKDASLRPFQQIHLFFEIACEISCRGASDVLDCWSLAEEGLDTHRGQKRAQGADAVSGNSPYGSTKPLRGSGGAVGLTTSIQLKLQSQALLTGTSLALGRASSGIGTPLKLRTAEEKGRDTKATKSQEAIHNRADDETSAGTAQSPHDTDSEPSEEENRRLKEALKMISEKRTVDNGILEDCQKLIQNPREQLRERQRELNKEKKTLTRQEKLEATIQETDESYKSWRAGMEEGLRQEDARHAAELEKLQQELKDLHEAKDPDAMKDNMDDEKPLQEGSMAQELQEVRESMREVAYHVETLEQRNQEMVMQMNSQVQALVSAIKGSKPIELFNEGSPQLIKRPQVIMSPRTNSHDRSRSPVKRSAEVAELKDVGEIHAMVRPLLKQIPEEHHHKIMAILESEGDKYQTLEAVEILIQQIAWPSLSEAGRFGEALQRWMQALDELVADLRLHLNRPDELLRVERREPPMASCYPQHARYIRHYDNNCDEGLGDCNGRRLTAETLSNSPLVVERSQVHHRLNECLQLKVQLERLQARERAAEKKRREEEAKRREAEAKEDGALGVLRSAKELEEEEERRRFREERLERLRQERRRQHEEAGERSEEYLFAPPKPRRHEGKVRKRPPTSKLKRVNLPQQAKKLPNPLPGHGHSRGHGIGKPAGRATYVNWPQVKIPFGADWHTEVASFLASKNLHLRDEGQQFYMEDSDGKRFKATSKHCQDVNLSTGGKVSSRGFLGLKPMLEATWTLMQNQPPRCAFLARNVRERGFFVDQLLDLIQRSLTCRCYYAPGVQTEEESEAMSHSSRESDREHHWVGYRCEVPRCSHCEGSCDCEWKDPLRRLIDAWRWSDWAWVDRMTRRGELADVNGPNWQGQTPLLLAAKHGHVRIATKDNRQLTLQRGNPQDGNNLIMLAAAKGHYEVCRFLLQCGCLVCGRLTGSMLKAAVDAGRPNKGCRGKCPDRTHMSLRISQGKTIAMLARHELRQQISYMETSRASHMETSRLLESRGIQ
eukprot:g3569.t1